MNFNSGKSFGVGYLTALIFWKRKSGRRKMETEPFNRLASNILDQAIARAEFWRQEARRLAGGDQAAFERALAMARKHANVKRYFEGLL